MSTADIATLVSLASEAKHPKPSKRLMKELSQNVSGDAKKVAEAITTGNDTSLSKEQREYFNVIVELASE